MSPFRLTVALFLSMFLAGSEAIFDGVNAQYHREQRHYGGYNSKRVTKSVKGKGTIGNVEDIKRILKKQRENLVVRDTDYYVRKNAGKRRAKAIAKRKQWISSQRSAYAKYMYQKKYKEAFIVAQKLAKLNLVDGKRFLGQMYFSGTGVKQNYKTSYAWFNDAATKDKDRFSKYMLGRMYLNGWSVDKDLAKAHDLFESADTKESLYCLGCLYKDGTGVEPDLKTAFNYFKKSDFKGYSKATAALGEAYLSGTGVDQDLGKAKALFDKAAQKGDAKAEFYLGEIYEKGLGVEKDPAIAKEHFDKWKVLADKVKTNKLSYGVLDKRQYSELEKRRKKI